MRTMMNSSAASLKKLSQPIFVVGEGHSGTTLLQRILSRNSSVHSLPGESKYFERLSIVRGAYPNLEDDAVLEAFLNYMIDCVRNGFKLGGISLHLSKGDIKSRTAGAPPTTIPPDKNLFDEMLAEAKRCRSHVDVFALVVDHLTRLSGKDYWLEKTPTHIHYIDEIMRQIPNAMIVEIVRDVRDILASKKTRRLTVWETDRYKPEERRLKSLAKAYDPLWDSLAWKSTIRAGRDAQRRYPDRFLSIRYEDLVAGPEAQIRKVCDFLSLEYQPEMLDVTRRNPAEEDKGGVGHGIVAASLGRWKKVITPPEAALCQWLTKSEMKGLGYSPAPIGFKHRAAAIFLILRSMLEFFQRLTKRWRLGGFSYFVNVVSNYWRRLFKLIYN